ncbi:ABC transporter ATP-binding protein [Pseudobutyrivibrio ruminis]|uniref:ABC transporter ATP-binding protein n=1 Tax=Pseudobutyrivibrio ruminis TaxID=46206 RepID=A0A2G3DTP2_9FIRM|nr:ABC transporter ATP-binding protein [Pseudobutyrivibrio ruminis]PHU34311.1 ABC transporter ATP-binding protein [Pseudobutyrivibrio ruminis]
MLKRIFALSDGGAKDLKKGIAATAIYNILLMVPVGIMMMLVLEMLTGIDTGVFKTDFGVGGFIALTLIMYVIIFISQWIQYDKTYTVAYEESANRRLTLAEKIRKLPLSFFGEKNLADLTTTMMGDCTALERTFSNAIPLMLGTLTMFAISAVCLIVIDWRMGLCILAPVPVAALIVIYARKAQQKAEAANMDAKRTAYDGVQEFLDTIQEIKSSSRENEYLGKIDTKLENVVKASFKNELAPGAATTTAQFVLRFGLVLVLLVGAKLVSDGTLSIPYFIMYLIMAGRIYDPFNSCFMLMAEIFSAMVSIKRTKEIEAIPEQSGSRNCQNNGYDIEFKDVEFAYNDEKVLKGVSFVAKQGQVTALVGPSGSGKSTVSRLASRFWDANKGKITLGGVDVSTIDQEVLLKNFSVVFQDVLLFDDTVMENIRLGRKDATDEEVIAAAKAACCEEFIDKLPEGYNTRIGENGSTLSGGERQRISIARALLKNAPIILLDEATASMDAESENLVQDALSVLLKNKTVIVIAHRMRTIANADQIIVLDDGKVVESGKPEQLITSGGLYSHMVALQKEA